MRLLYDIKTVEPGEVEISGSVLIGASSAVTSCAGHGFTVAKVGTGLWDITFDDSYPTDLGIDLSDNQPTAQATKFILVTPYNATTRKTRIGNYQNGGGGAAHPTSGNGFDFVAHFKRVHY
jgi:hypothetical protein